MHLGWVFTAIDPHRGLHRVREEEEKAGVGSGDVVQRFLGLRRMPLTNNIAEEGHSRIEFELVSSESYYSGESGESGEGGGMELLDIWRAQGGADGGAEPEVEGLNGGTGSDGEEGRDVR